jgi:hypothetical protein
MVKNCNKCNLDREVEDFPPNGNGGRRTICKFCNRIADKLRREKNPNACKERYARDKVRMLSRTRIWANKNKEQIRARRFERYANNIPKVLLKTSLHRAKTKGMEHTLKLEDIKIPENCPVLGIPLLYEKSNGMPRHNSPSIDRIDNTRGYTKDNIVIVSRRANVLKNDASVEELKKIVIFYDNLINKR